jgi:16S rRNA processing protein RimM
VSANRKTELKLGYVVGVYGIKGWLKVHSYTEPRANIVQYPDWSLKQRGTQHAVRLEDGGAKGQQVLAKLAGIEDRDQAAELVGAEIWVARDALPAPDPGQYYWADLEGMSVTGPSGELLGEVEYLIDAGVHAVMVLKGEAEAMIPFVLDEVVTEVDLERREIRVNWDASFFDG